MPVKLHGLVLTHYMEVECAKRSLTISQFLNCLSRAITLKYQNRGKIVSVSVSLQDGQVSIYVDLMVSQNGHSAWQPVTDVAAPSAEMLQKAVEEYLYETRMRHGWALVKATVLATESDYYLVQLDAPDQPDLHTKTAVLPKSDVFSCDLWRKDTAQPQWAAIRDHVTEIIPGGESWNSVAAPYYASRASPQFVKLVYCYYYPDVEIKVFVNSETALIIFPQTYNLSLVIGEKGAIIKRMIAITGLARIHTRHEISKTNAHPRSILSRSVLSVTEASKNEFSIGEITPAERNYLIQCGIEDLELPTHTIVANERNMPKIVGANGRNLYFIYCLSGVKFKTVIGTPAPRKPRPRPITIPHKEAVPNAA